jgi:uncharacterized membrane protein YgdD (TMEM256/DUF423 family)
VVPVIEPSQLSVDIGALGAVTLHSPVKFAKLAEFGTGAVTSSIMTFCVCVLLLPSTSVKVQVIIVVPAVVIGKVVVVVPVIAPSQLSVAVGAVGAETLHSAVKSAKLVASATGAVISSTITF